MRFYTNKLATHLFLCLSFILLATIVPMEALANLVDFGDGGTISTKANKLISETYEIGWYVIGIASVIAMIAIGVWALSPEPQYKRAIATFVAMVIVIVIYGMGTGAFKAFV